jgi:two-component system, cell cycle sensor histidine kinase PleC
MSFIGIVSFLLFAASAVGLAHLAWRYRNPGSAILAAIAMCLGIWSLVEQGHQYLLLFVSIGSMLVFATIKQIVHNLSTLETSLKESERKYRSIFENAEVALTQVRLSDSKMLDANNRAAEILGYDSRLQMIKDYQADKHWGAPELRQQAFAEGAKRGVARDREAEVTRLDGSAAWLRVATTFFPEEDYLLAVALDITERRKVEEALRESEKKYRALFNNAQVGLLRTTIDEGHAIEANAQMAALLGFDDIDDLLKNYDVRKAYVDQEHMVRIVAQVKKMGSLESVESDFYRKDGSILQARVYARLIPEENEIETVLVDIGDQKKIQKNLIAALDQAEQANRTKSDFLANMSHELRTPLNAILGFSQMIRDQVMGKDAMPQYQEYAGFISTSGEHLLALIGDILDLSKIEAGKAELAEVECDLAALIDESVDFIRLAAEGSDLKISVKCDLAGRVFTADERMVKQMLLNLMSNAVKFNRVGGTIDVSAIFHETNGLAIVVADTGVGIEADDIAISLSKFGQVGDVLTREVQGTGLGLPLVASMAELHGGRLDLESEPGAGTIATIWFPSARCQPIAAASID